MPHPDAEEANAALAANLLANLNPTVDRMTKKTA